MIYLGGEIAIQRVSRPVFYVLGLVNQALSVDGIKLPCGLLDESILPKTSPDNRLRANSPEDPVSGPKFSNSSFDPRWDSGVFPEDLDNHLIQCVFILLLVDGYVLNNLFCELKSKI